jgi:hypothetical protein
MLNGRFYLNSIVAMAFTDEAIEDVKVVLLETPFDFGTDLSSAIRSFSDYFGDTFYNLPADKFFGLSYVTFAPFIGDLLFDKLSDSTSVIFTGAVASNHQMILEQTESDTIVFGNKTFTKTGIVMALFKSKSAFVFEKMESVSPLSLDFTVTKLKDDNRTILELNGLPAVKAVYDALGLIGFGDSLKEIKQNNRSLTFAKLIDNLPYLYAADVTHYNNSGFNEEDGSIKLLSRTKVGMHFSLYQISEDIISNTQYQYQQIKDKHNNSLFGFIQFCCMARYEQLEQLKQTTEYEQIFSDIPNIGFTALGEYYINYVNYTSTLFCFKNLPKKSDNKTAGEIHRLVQILFNDVAKGNAVTFSYIRTKLLLKGINPDIYGPSTIDPPVLLETLQKFLKSLYGTYKNE